MGICRKTLVMLFGSLVVLAMAIPGFAWEFAVNGSLEWKWNYYAQQGTQGFFGPFDVSNNPAAFQARSNAWLGIEDYDGLFYGQHPGVVSGADASQSTMQMDLWPSIKINPAISVFSKCRIGGHYAGNNQLTGDRWDDIGPFNTKYINFLVPGQDNAQSFFEITMLWMGARTPWGSVSFGKRPFAVGCGLLYNSTDATQESLMLNVPWGPFRLGLGFYPMTIGHGDFYDVFRRQYEQNFYLGLPYYYFPNQFWDKSAHPNKILALLTYDAQNLTMGAGAQYTSLHFGTEGVEDATVSVPAIDQTDLEAWFYFKFNNGRFFFNAEVDHINRLRRYGPTVDGTLPTVQGPPVLDPLDDGGGNFFAPQYVESWRWMAETGVYMGPSKISFLYAFLPGPDRRHGVLIDRQPTTFLAVVPETASDAVWLNRHVGNSSVFRPYSMLICNEYGAGVNCYDLGGNGCMTDATVLAARLDYAVAANLNLFASFFRAERDSHAWQWGCIRPGSRVEETFDEDSAFRQVIFRPRGPGRIEFTQPVPTIPDTELGWEVGLGAEWALLENWQLTINGAYWRPGKWFSYACVDRSLPGWSTGARPPQFGINPNRTIDPIVGMEVTMKASF